MLTVEVNFLISEIEQKIKEAKELEMQGKISKSNTGSS